MGRRLLRRDIKKLDNFQRFGRWLARRLAGVLGGPSADEDEEAARWASASRNDPCPCGSNKKYKKCCWEKRHH